MDDAVYKILLGGWKGVGKTMIFKELQRQSQSGIETVQDRTGMSSRYERGIWTARMHSHGSEVTVELWDTGNMEHSGLQSMKSSTYWNNGQAVILVYDTGDRESLNELSKWIPVARDLSRDDDIIVSLWGNNTGNTTNPVDEKATENFAATFGIPSALVFTVTASTGDKLIDSYKSLVDMVHLMNTNQARAHELLRRRHADRVQLGTHTEQQRSSWKEWCCGAM